MYLDALKIANFKNLETQDLTFNPAPGINILLGQNGQGKTNLLEAIRFLAVPKPLRSRSINDCIGTEGNYFRICGNFTESEITSLEFGYQKTPLKRVYKIDSGETDLKTYIGRLRAVMFTPDDLNMLLGSPGLRRRFIDVLLTQVSSEYFEALGHYHHALKQRNALLKSVMSGIAKREHLPIWNDRLADHMKIIYEWRQDFLGYCQQELTNIYQDMSETDDILELSYPFAGKEITKETLIEGLESTITEDLRFGHTNFGPHRDDFVIKINQRDSKIVASRGELRSIVLSLKLIELDYITDKTFKKPLLMLDDVFSELDAKRREKLLLISEKQQTLITTVEAGYFRDAAITPQIYKVNSGLIKRDVI